MTHVIPHHTGQLTYIREVNATFLKNESRTLLKLKWMEPTVTGYASQVDFYLLTVNRNNYNITETLADVNLSANESSATISLEASNCAGSTPTTVVHFLLLNGNRISYNYVIGFEKRQDVKGL